MQSLLSQAGAALQRKALQGSLLIRWESPGRQTFRQTDRVQRYRSSSDSLFHQAAGRLPRKYWIEGIGGTCTTGRGLHPTVSAGQAGLLKLRLFREARWYQLLQTLLPLQLRIAEQHRCPRPRPCRKPVYHHDHRRRRAARAVIYRLQRPNESHRCLRASLECRRLPS